MKKTTYDDLPILPWLIASTICERAYKGQEFSPGMLSPEEITQTEILRKKLTTKQINAFAEYVDQRCKAAFEAKAPWFMKIARSKTNAGRDQLYIFVTHWMTSWLNNHRKELLCLK